MTPSVDTSLIPTGFPLPHPFLFFSCVVCLLYNDRYLSPCAVFLQSVSIYNLAILPGLAVFSFFISFLISLCFLRVPARGSWKKKHPIWSLSTHYLPLDFSPFPRIGFAFAVLSSSLSSKA